MGLSQTSLDFGDVLLGQTSSVQTITLQNIGYVHALVLGPLALSGADAGDFTLSSDSCSNQTLAQDTTCSFDIALTPSAREARSALVDIPSNAPSGPDVVALDGAGVQPAVGLSATNIDFGAVVVGQTSTVQTLTLENTGSADLIIGVLALSGVHAVDFALANDGCSNQSIAPAASCTVELTLAPAALGPRTAQLEVPSNAPSSPDAVAT